MSMRLPKMAPGLEPRFPRLDLDRDRYPDSYCMGWDTYFDGGCGSTHDPEIDADLFRKGWEAAKSHSVS